MDIHDLRNKLKGYVDPKNENYNDYCNIIDNELSIQDLSSSLNYMDEVNASGRIHEISELKNNEDGFYISTNAGMHFFR